MRPSSSGAILALLPFFLGLFSFVTASTSNDTAGDAGSPLHSKRCTKPQVRREWRALSEEERTEWITAVKCLKKVPHKDYIVPYPHVNYTEGLPLYKNNSMFDDFCYVHIDLNPVIHFTGHFLPWHRSFIHRFERALREECGFTGTQPYWDWTKDADNFYNSSFFDPNPKSGLGGWGDPSDDIQITTGAFASDFVQQYPVPHRLRRNYTAISLNPETTEPLYSFFTPEIVKEMVDGFPGDYVGFQKYFEGGEGPHGAIHQIVGGDLFGWCPKGAAPDCKRGPKWTANDPLFYLHHTMVDKLWDEWQRRRPENFWAFQGGSVSAGPDRHDLSEDFPNGGPPFLNFDTDIPGDGLLNNATIFEMMDIRAYDFCYTYE